MSLRTEEQLQSCLEGHCELQKQDTLDSLLRELTTATTDINKKIRKGDATNKDMEDFRDLSFDIQKRMYRISRHHYTEDLCSNIRSGVHSNYHYQRVICG